MLGPHEVLKETALLVGDIHAGAYLASDHYTNYINLEGWLLADKQRLLSEIDRGLERDESRYRAFFVGTQ